MPTSHEVYYGFYELSRAATIISILPMAHMYGMAFELIFEFYIWCPYFLPTRMPSPAIIAQALAEN